MKDILKINRAKWRTGGDSDYQTGNGDTQLLNHEGFMCCLGFRCNQLGIPKGDLVDVGEPNQLSEEWIIPDLVNRNGYNTLFCGKAIDINDDEDITQREREKRIKNHFSKKGIKVIFTGKYRKEDE